MPINAGRTGSERQIFPCLSLELVHFNQVNQFLLINKLATDRFWVSLKEKIANFCLKSGGEPKTSSWICSLVAVCALLIFCSLWRPWRNSAYLQFWQPASLAYAVMLGTVPLIVLHISLLPLNIWRLIQMRTLMVKMQSSPGRLWFYRSSPFDEASTVQEGEMILKRARKQQSFLLLKMARFIWKN